MVSPTTLKRKSPRGTALIRFVLKHPPLSRTTRVSPTEPLVVPGCAPLRIAASSTKDTRKFWALALVIASGKVPCRYSVSPSSRLGTVAAACSALGLRSSPLSELVVSSSFSWTRIRSRSSFSPPRAKLQVELPQMD